MCSQPPTRSPRRRHERPHMSVSRKICAVIPVKETAQAKQRLADAAPRRAAAGVGARHVRRRDRGRKQRARACRHRGGHGRCRGRRHRRPPRRPRHERGRLRRPHRRGHDGGTTPGGGRPRPADAAGRHPAGRTGTMSGTSCAFIAPAPIAERAPSPSCQRATSLAPTPCCARRPTQCRCASATTASSRIWTRPKRMASSPRWCTCRASRLISIRPRTWRYSSSTPSQTARVCAVAALAHSPRRRRTANNHRHERAADYLRPDWRPTP